MGWAKLDYDVIWACQAIVANLRFQLGFKEAEALDQLLGMAVVAVVGTDNRGSWLLGSRPDLGGAHKAT